MNDNTNHAKNLTSLKGRMGLLVSLTREDIKKAETNMLEIAKERYLGKVLKVWSSETLFLIDEIRGIEHIYRYGLRQYPRYDFTMNVNCQSVCPVDGKAEYWKKSSWSFDLDLNGELTGAKIVDKSEFMIMKNETLARIDSYGRELKEEDHVYFSDNGALYDGNIDSFDTENGLVHIKLKDGATMSKKSTELLKK